MKKYARHGATFSRLGSAQGLLRHRNQFAHLTETPEERRLLAAEESREYFRRSNRDVKSFEREMKGYVLGTLPQTRTEAAAHQAAHRAESMTFNNLTTQRLLNKRQVEEIQQSFLPISRPLSQAPPQQSPFASAKTPATAASSSSQWKGIGSDGSVLLHDNDHSGGFVHKLRKRSTLDPPEIQLKKRLIREAKRRVRIRRVRDAYPLTFSMDEVNSMFGGGGGGGRNEALTMSNGHSGQPQHADQNTSSSQPSAADTIHSFVGDGGGGTSTTSSSYSFNSSGNLGVIQRHMAAGALRGKRWAALEERLDGIDEAERIRNRRENLNEWLLAAAAVQTSRAANNDDTNTAATATTTTSLGDDGFPSSAANNADVVASGGSGGLSVNQKIWIRSQFDRHLDTFDAISSAPAFATSGTTPQATTDFGAADPSPPSAVDDQQSENLQHQSLEALLKAEDDRVITMLINQSAAAVASPSFPAPPSTHHRSVRKLLCHTKRLRQRRRENSRRIIANPRGIRFIPTPVVEQMTAEARRKAVAGIAVDVVSASPAPRQNNNSHEAVSETMKSPDIQVTDESGEEMGITRRNRKNDESPILLVHRAEPFGDGLNTIPCVDRKAFTAAAAVPHNHHRNSQVYHERKRARLTRFWLKRRLLLEAKGRSRREAQGEEQQKDERAHRAARRDTDTYMQHDGGKQERREACNGATEGGEEAEEESNYYSDLLFRADEIFSDPVLVELALAAGIGPLAMLESKHRQHHQQRCGAADISSPPPPPLPSSHSVPSGGQVNNAQNNGGAQQQQSVYKEGGMCGDDNAIKAMNTQRQGHDVAAAGSTDKGEKDSSACTTYDGGDGCGATADIEANENHRGASRLAINGGQQLDNEGGSSSPMTTMATERNDQPLIDRSQLNLERLQKRFGQSKASSVSNRLQVQSATAIADAIRIVQVVVDAPTKGERMTVPPQHVSHLNHHGGGTVTESTRSVEATAATPSPHDSQWNFSESDRGVDEENHHGTHRDTDEIHDTATTAAAIDHEEVSPVAEEESTISTPALILATPIDNEGAHKTPKIRLLALVKIESSANALDGGGEEAAATGSDCHGDGEGEEDATAGAFGGKEHNVEKSSEPLTVIQKMARDRSAYHQTAHRTFTEFKQHMVSRRTRLLCPRLVQALTSSDDFRLLSNSDLPKSVRSLSVANARSHQTFYNFPTDIQWQLLRSMLQKLSELPEVERLQKELGLGHVDLRKHLFRDTEIDSFIIGLQRAQLLKAGHYFADSEECIPMPFRSGGFNLWENKLKDALETNVQENKNAIATTKKEIRKYRTKLAQLKAELRELKKQQLGKTTSAERKNLRQSALILKADMGKISSTFLPNVIDMLHYYQDQRILLKEMQLMAKTNGDEDNPRRFNLVPRQVAHYLLHRHDDASFPLSYSFKLADKARYEERKEMENSAFYDRLIDLLRRKTNEVALETRQAFEKGHGADGVTRAPSLETTASVPFSFDQLSQEFSAIDVSHLIPRIGKTGDMDRRIEANSQLKASICDLIRGLLLQRYIAQYHHRHQDTRGCDSASVAVSSTTEANEDYQGSNKDDVAEFIRALPSRGGSDGGDDGHSVKQSCLYTLIPYTAAAVVSIMAFPPVELLADIGAISAYSNNDIRRFRAFGRDLVFASEEGKSTNIIPATAAKGTAASASVSTSSYTSSLAQSAKEAAEEEEAMRSGEAMIEDDKYRITSSEQRSWRNHCLHRLFNVTWYFWYQYSAAGEWAADGRIRAAFEHKASIMPVLRRRLERLRPAAIEILEECLDDSLDLPTLSSTIRNRIAAVIQNGNGNEKKSSPPPTPRSYGERTNRLVLNSLANVADVLDDFIAIDTAKKQFLGRRAEETTNGDGGEAQQQNDPSSSSPDSSSSKTTRARLDDDEENLEILIPRNRRTISVITPEQFTVYHNFDALVNQLNREIRLLAALRLVIIDVFPEFSLILSPQGMDSIRENSLREISSGGYISNIKTLSLELSVRSSQQLSRVQIRTRQRRALQYTLLHPAISTFDYLRKYVDASDQDQFEDLAFYDGLPREELYPYFKESKELVYSKKYISGQGGEKSGENGHDGERSSHGEKKENGIDVVEGDGIYSLPAFRVRATPTRGAKSPVLRAVRRKLSTAFRSLNQKQKEALLFAVPSGNSDRSDVSESVKGKRAKNKKPSLGYVL